MPGIQFPRFSGLSISALILIRKAEFDCAEPAPLLPQA
jgi:hypothetical protein